MKKFPPFLIALFAGIAQGFSLAPANQWLQLAALAVLFFIFAGLRTVKAGFLAGLFFGFLFCILNVLMQNGMGSRFPYGNYLLRGLLSDDF